MDVTNCLLIYTVYDHPSDFPEKFVVRRSTSKGGKVVHESVPYMIAEQYKTIRLQLELLGLVCLSRYPDDDPVIKETWL